VAVDRTSKLVFARIYRSATKLAAAGFLKALVRTVPYKIHTCSPITASSSRSPSAARTATSSSISSNASVGGAKPIKAACI